VKIAETNYRKPFVFISNDTQGESFLPKQTPIRTWNDRSSAEGHAETLKAFVHPADNC